MDIKLNAKLSAYGKLPSPKACNTSTITKEDIDSLFDKNNSNNNNNLNTSDISNKDIDALFKR